ncbi:hypothetical protein H0H92_010896 [Tricholoma furcatifolium]|nr:hypothetical protein H0H92_010896 [Tricholoma furcatifolium]
MFSRPLYVLGAICLPLCFATTPKPHNIGPSAHNAHLEDPKCPEGFYPGTQTNTWQFTVPVGTWTNKTGSFLGQEWYTGPVNSTLGKDNTIGTTRTIHFRDTVFVDRLIEFYESPAQSVIRFTLDNGPVTLENILTFASYTEELRSMSICGGIATQYTMVATYCSDRVLFTYNFYDQYRRTMVQKVADELGVFMFDGTCPQINDRKV